MSPKDNNTTMQQQALRKTFLSERKNLESMIKWPHTNILAMLGSFECLEPASFNLIFLFAEGGGLLNFMRLRATQHEEPNEIYLHLSNMCDEYAAWEHGILDQCIGLLSALSYIHHGIHGNLIMHRDINPANILIHNRKFMLTGFGEAHIKVIPTSTKMELKFGPALDVWGLGCVFFELAVMLAHLRYEDLPSVVGFEDRRISWLTANSDEHGRDIYPANAFARKGVPRK
ncbi:hypothetical protein ACMFMG_009027 [Clarireedia jacksonii]